MFLLGTCAWTCRCAAGGERVTLVGYFPKSGRFESEAEGRSRRGVSAQPSAEYCSEEFVPRHSWGRFQGVDPTRVTETASGAPSSRGFERNSLFDRCWTMFALRILLSLLPIATFAFPHCTRSPEASGRAGEVFTSKEEANSFIPRRLLYNRFDLELFTSGDLERECYEELCNYEEAKEIFVDEDKTVAFWQEYSIKQPTTKSGGNSEKVDVMGLLTGLIAAGVFLVILGILGYHLFITKCSRQQHPGSPRGRQAPSIIFRRPEEAALSPSPPSLEDTGLPSYEQAMALTRKHNVSPPPPYPGPAKGFRVFKKSMSLPSH